MKKVMYLMLLLVYVSTFFFLTGASAKTAMPASSLGAGNNLKCSVDFEIKTYIGGSISKITINNLSDEEITD
jgi:hypothetical protein